MSPEPEQFDVVIIGGAMSGAASALLLKRQRPELRVLILEKSKVFGRRVGEATVEISTYFLTKILGLTTYLNESHLVKQGMRFWFFNDQTRSLDECAEVGGRMLSRLISFQVDRARLDQEILDRAVAAGAILWRPAEVANVELNAGGQQKLEVRCDGQSRNVQARWVVDASGVAALLARRNGWLRQNNEHPTAAAWSRWRGVKDWDGYELAQKYPRWQQACYGIRSTATNHMVGDGWWAWFIPLKGGDTSVGIVIDQRLAQLPEDGPIGDRIKTFLSRHPVSREMLADAQWEEGDVHWRKNLPYYTTVFAGDGFALVGDASAFLDPFYSPGLDWIAFTTMSAARLILTQHKGEPVAKLIEEHNRKFSTSYRRWFRGIYKDKYEYMGEFDLMRVAFVMDIGLYYTGVVSQPFRRGPESYYEPVYSTVPSIPFYWLMRTYNRRLAAMARDRRRRNALGRRNANQRFLFPGFGFSLPTQLRIVRALASWGVLELGEGWRTWFRSEKSGSGLHSETENSSSSPNPGRSIPKPAQPVQ
ncbi:MAG TPA: NAD(P)/FAD-dependent oxidoreductase [Candidatus Baltobacteraceae bacterium]|jgi:flavin-dependent dehydrogenase|nr:NAD(P)/FAD-dependent oxidoreductase [Candidatus Baltobacteraceae bacterium]